MSLDQYSSMSLEDRTPFFHLLIPTVFKRMLLHSRFLQSRGLIFVSSCISTMVFNTILILPHCTAVLTDRKPFKRYLAYSVTYFPRHKSRRGKLLSNCSTWSVQAPKYKKISLQESKNNDQHTICQIKSGLEQKKKELKPSY